mmetsp:Transcript_16727/g.25277  ORF Transcript_16727/g.25277 Transcript_16727/m.25277 type:complete len:206 (-) Transcript_16727:113-730(-)
MEKEEDEDEWIDLYADTERNRKPSRRKSQQKSSSSKRSTKSRRRSSSSSTDLITHENGKIPRRKCSSLTDLEKLPRSTSMKKSDENRTNIKRKSSNLTDLEKLPPSTSTTRNSNLKSISFEINPRNSERFATAKKSIEVWKASKYVPDMEPKTKSNSRTKLSSSTGEGDSEIKRKTKRKTKRVNNYLEELFKSPSQSVLIEDCKH